MKEKIIVLILACFGLSCIRVDAHSNHSRPVYLVQKDYSKNEYKFQNCTKHSLIKETTVYLYSNGTRNTHNNYSVINNDGSLLLNECSKISHAIHNEKHFFIFYKNKKYQLMDETGNFITVKKYTKMEQIAQNKLLVCFNKKYGIIDFDENVVVPIIYKSITQTDKNLFLTKLNGYYGLIDADNKTILKNEYDKIKIMPEIFIIKKDKKFGILNKNGEMVINPEYDAIKDFGEYLSVKKDGKFGVINTKGKKISNVCYKKIKQDHNVLFGQLNSKNWVKILDNNL